MSDFNQTFRPTEGQDKVSTHQEPIAFQDFAANVWGRPSQNDQGGGGIVERASFSSNARKSIPEIPGVLTKLDGITTDHKTEVTVTATVSKIMPDVTDPNTKLAHEHFLIQMDDGTKVFVAHDLSYAPHVPLTVGEKVKIKGEWIPEPQEHEKFSNEKTIGVLHWTHGPGGWHPSGYIEAGGLHYDNNKTGPTPIHN